MEKFATYNAYAMISMSFTDFSSSRLNGLHEGVMNIFHEAYS